MGRQRQRRGDKETEMGRQRQRRSDRDGEGEREEEGEKTAPRSAMEESPQPFVGRTTLMGCEPRG